MRTDIIAISCMCMALVAVLIQGGDVPWLFGLALIVLTGVITGFITWVFRLPTEDDVLDTTKSSRWERVLVHRTGNCEKIFIPPKYCTIYLLDTKSCDVEIDMVGADTCVQVLNTKKFKCMKEGLTLEGDKWVRVKK
jgi:hypothetical protein